MWIFTFAPDWVTHLIFGLGVFGIILGFLLGFIPFIKPYKLAIQVISMILFAFGVYLEGGLADYKEWEFKANELKAKISKMETDMANADVKVVEKIVVQKQVIREKGRDIIRYVENEVVRYDDKFARGQQCELPQEFYKAYNDSLGKDQK